MKVFSMRLDDAMMRRIKKAKRNYFKMICTLFPSFVGLKPYTTADFLRAAITQGLDEMEKKLK